MSSLASPKSLSDLPGEMLFMIFSHLSEKKREELRHIAPLWDAIICNPRETLCPIPRERTKFYSSMKEKEIKIIPSEESNLLDLFQALQIRSYESDIFQALQLRKKKLLEKTLQTEVKIIDAKNVLLNFFKMVQIPKIKNISPNVKESSIISLSFQFDGIDDTFQVEIEEYVKLIHETNCQITDTKIINHSRSEFIRQVTEIAKEIEFNWDIIENYKER